MWERALRQGVVRVNNGVSEQLPGSNRAGGRTQGGRPSCFSLHSNRPNSQSVRAFKNECFAEMWSGSEEGSYSRLIEIVASLNSRLESNDIEEAIGMVAEHTAGVLPASLSTQIARIPKV